jgi:hypothetical protein
MSDLGNTSIDLHQGVRVGLMQIKKRQIRQAVRIEQTSPRCICRLGLRSDMRFRDEASDGP